MSNLKFLSPCHYFYLRLFGYTIKRNTKLLYSFDVPRHDYAHRQRAAGVWSRYQPLGHKETKNGIFHNCPIYGKFPKTQDYLSGWRLSVDSDHSKGTSWLSADKETFYWVTCRLRLLVWAWQLMCYLIPQTNSRSVIDAQSIIIIVKFSYEILLTR